MTNDNPGQPPYLDYAHAFDSGHDEGYEQGKRDCGPDMTPYQLGVAANMASNGRAFCGLVALVDVVGGHPLLGLVAALPVGLSVLLDPLPGGPYKIAGAIATQAMAACVFLASAIILW